MIEGVAVKYYSQSGNNILDKFMLDKQKVIIFAYCERNARK